MLIITNRNTEVNMISGFLKTSKQIIAGKDGVFNYAVLFYGHRKQPVCSKAAG